MKSIAVFGILLISLLKCDGNQKEKDAEPVCGVGATVVDATGLDGCGLVIKLDTDGETLLPERRVYVTAPTREEDPLYYFELKAGQHIRVSYNETNNPNSCMAGPTVFVTCITEIK